MKIVNRLDLGGPCLRAAFLEDAACFLAVDGRLHVQQGDARREVLLHDGDVLSATLKGPEGRRTALLTAGEDGRVVLSGPHGVSTCVASVPNKWVTALAAGPDDSLAYACGRTVWLQDGAGRAVSRTLDRPLESLRFSRDGRVLAAGLYDGVTLLSSQSDDTTVLPLKGVPVRLTFSAGDRFLLAATRDAVLHGWRLDTGRHFRMVGYPRPIASWSWTGDGLWLATDGSAGAVLWPFDGEDGPIGSAPHALSDRPEGVVSAIACHPVQPWLAVGYADGLMVLESRDGDVRRTLGQASRDPVTVLEWDAQGARLAYATSGGPCGVIGMG